MTIKTLFNFFYLYQKSENLPKEKAKKSDLLLVFLVILLSGTLINISISLQFIVTCTLVIYVSFLFIKNTNLYKSNLVNILLIVLLTALIFIGKYFTSEFTSLLKYGSLFTNILLALFILLYFSKKPESLTNSIYIVLYFIMLHALFSLVAWYAIGGFLSYAPILKTYTFGYIFYYVYTDSDLLNAMRTINIFGFSFFRGSGIFWEPGILQIYMNILLFLSLYIYPNRKISLLSAVTIFTTWSSTGMVILIIQLFFYMILQLRKQNILKTIVLIGLFTIMIIPLQENLMSKLVGKDAGSGFSRALDTLTAINIIKNNPLFGIPLDPEAHQKELLQNRANVNMPGSRDVRDANNTNSILNYFVFFGIPLGILILYSLYNQTIFLKHQLPFFILIALGMLTEPIGFYIFPLMLIFSRYILKIQQGVRHEFKNV